MKLWRSMMKLPQPINGCLVVDLSVFAAAFVFSKPVFIRFFGGMLALIGVGFVLGSMIFASRSS